MARITPEQIEQINEVYYQCGVKTRTAKIVGVSVASVTKYLIPDYKPKSERQEEVIFSKQPTSPSPLSWQSFFDSCSLSENEWEELKLLQKEIYI